jgi:hypothetical protein
MKRILMLVLGLAGAMMAEAQTPTRVAVLEFQDQTGMKADALQGGGIAPGAMAEKGVFVLGKTLANRPGFTLIDRRDLMEQMEKLAPKDQGEATPTKPSFLQAAQLLRADVVLRGSILSLSSGKQMVNQGGYQADLSTLSVRIGLEALDATDGSVIAASDGVARHRCARPPTCRPSLGEDDVLMLMEKSVGEAVPALEKALTARAEAQKQRPTIKLAIKTDADPALVEIDGVLVGSTPIEQIDVYKGDHVLTISKPGYQQVTKRIQFDDSARIDVPMLREQMTAEEWAKIYEKASLKIIKADPGVIVNSWE